MGSYRDEIFGRGIETAKSEHPATVVGFSASPFHQSGKSQETHALVRLCGLGSIWLDRASLSVTDYRRWCLGAFFILAGLNHFLSKSVYLELMPPYLPWHLQLVYLSGVAEV